MAGKSAASPTSNPLLTTTKATDTSSLSVQLHPLVLLTISDYITRHASRRQNGPIVGAVIGQQTGRNFTLEHAYECKVEIVDIEAPEHDSAGGARIDGQWFTERLQQYRDVHKAPALDLQAVFMLGPLEQGPGQMHAEIVRQVLGLTSASASSGGSSSGDSIMLLLFHPELVEQLQGGKLPITLYESVQEQQEGGGGEVELKFRELAFEVETGEAEMIGVDFVATGGGNATAVSRTETATAAGASLTSAEGSSKEKDKDKDKKVKGKGKAKDKDGEEAETNGAATVNVLSAEDEELIASLTAKANAIKMLDQRIKLIRSYLGSLPSSSLTDSTSTGSPPPESTNHTLLRSINAMISRLPLLNPPPPSTSPSATNGQTTTTSPEVQQSTPAPTAGDKEKSSVHLTALLASLTRSIAEAQSMGSKLHIVQRERAAKERSPFSVGNTRGGGAGRLGFGDESGLLVGTGSGGGGADSGTGF